MVLQATDIVCVIGEHVALKKMGKDFQGLCPFHPDHTPSMSVSPTKQIFKCWSCGAGGDVIGFVKRFTRVEYRDALLSLASRAGIDVSESAGDREAAERRAELLRVSTWAAEWFQSNLNGAGGESARAYAVRRGLSAATLTRHRIGLAPNAWDSLLSAARAKGVSAELLREAGLLAANDQGRQYDRFRNRLIFPIADPQGRPIAFGGRTLGDDAAKYLNSPESPLFSKSRVLYAFDLARRAIEKQRAAIIVEGYMDAVLLHQHGFENVVATLGTALTDAHVQLLRTIAGTLFMCFDSDAAGVRAADRAVEIALKSDVAVRVIQLTGDKDPADCVVDHGRAAFEDAVASAIDALEFKWRQLQAQFGSDGRSRRSATESYLQFVASVTSAGNVDPLTQDLLVGRLADLLGISGERVFELIASARRRLPRVASEDRAAEQITEDEAAGAAPAGLTPAVETVLGLLAINYACWRYVDDSIQEACGYYQTWEDLYHTLLDVHADASEYSIGDVVARCDEPAVCDLLGRACARCHGVVDVDAHFDAARRTLAAELDALRMDNLRGSIAPAGANGAQAYCSLLKLAQSQHGFLPAGRRREASSVPPA